MTGAISDTPANANKFKRLRDRQYITNESKVNIMVVNGKAEDFFNKIPELDEASKKLFAGYALSVAEMIAKNYPPQKRLDYKLECWRIC